MKPLWHHLYYDTRYTELARLIGYGGMSMKDKANQTQIEALGKKHGHKEMQEIAKAIARFDEPTQKYMLNDEARKLCFQLLGPAPEHEEFSAFEEQRKQWAAEEPPETHAQTEKKRQTKSRKANAKG